MRNLTKKHARERGSTAESLARALVRLPHDAETVESKAFKKSHGTMGGGPRPARVEGLTREELNDRVEEGKRWPSQEEHGMRYE